MRNKLMIGVAAIALVAGNSLAMAQGKGHEQAPAAAPQAAPAASQNGGPGGAARTEQGAQPDQGGGRNAQDMKTEPSSQAAAPAEQGSTPDSRKGKNAQAPSKGKNAQNAPANGANARGKTERESAEHGKTSAEQNGGERGKADTAATEKGREGGGASVKLSADQRTRVQKLVINEHNAPRVAHVDFSINVGTVIPRDRVHIVPVPETIVEIEPEWRGFMYFIVGSQFVIVEPDSLRIVAVIAV